MSSRVFGIVLLVVGLILLGFGWNAHDSAADSIKEGLTGSYTDTTMWYLIGGAALAIGGAGLALVGGKGARTP
jgi:hypothetical protein